MQRCIRVQLLPAPPGSRPLVLGASVIPAVAEVLAFAPPPDGGQVLGYGGRQAYDHLGELRLAEAAPAAVGCELVAVVFAQHRRSAPFQRAIAPWLAAARAGRIDLGSKGLAVLTVTGCGLGRDEILTFAGWNVNMKSGDLAPMSVTLAFKDVEVAA